MALAGLGTQCQKKGPRERTPLWGLDGKKWTEPAEELGSEPEPEPGSEPESETEKAEQGRRFDVAEVPTGHPDAEVEEHSLV